MKLEIVTSIYKDEHKLKSWLDIAKSYNLTVYQKIDNLDHKPEFFMSGCLHFDNNYPYAQSWGKTTLPNYGRCDYAFLWHIINKWDNLADTTVFVKNNWQDTNNRLCDVISVASDYDFVENGGPLKWQVVGEYYPHKTQGFEVEDRRINKHIYKAEGMLEWSRFIWLNPDDWPPPWLASVHGPCFSVSRELIKRHDISVYRYLLNRFYPESKSWNQKLAREKCGLDTIEKQIDDSGRHFHDELLRFWHILFCHQAVASSDRNGLYIHV